MAIIVKQLIAQRAFIEKLQSLLIQVKGAIFGGERFVNNNDKVVDMGTDKTGFCIAQDGILKASGAEISGHIEADSGELNNVVIKEESVFRGDIFAGPLTLTSINIDSRIFTFGPSFYGNAVYNAVVAYLGYAPSLAPTEGTMNALGRVSILNYISFNVSAQEMTLYLTNGNTSINAVISTRPGATGNVGTLSFQFKVGNKMMRLDKLPTTSAGLPAGAVYRDGNNLKIV